MWLKSTIDLLCWPIPCSRAAMTATAGLRFPDRRGIPSARNFSRSIFAAANSLPGGLVVLMRMYLLSRSVASAVTWS